MPKIKRTLRVVCLRTGAALIVLLSGCSGRDSEPAALSPADYDVALNSWIGRNEADLIRAWGVPTRSQLLSPGGQVLEYVQRRDDQIVCTTLFTSNLLGVLESWTWRGQRCHVPRLGGDEAAH